LLRADSVSYTWRTRAGRRGSAPEVEAGVRAVSLSIGPGALVGILGPNGSGKTTLLRLLAGILRPATGRVLLDEEDLAAVPRARVARRVAVVPQETHLAFEYSVLEVALMGRYPHLGPFEIEGPDDLAIARDALASTGTIHLERRALSTLSGGEKQRVIIASALAQAADVLLLDEPTASLDIGYQIEIANLLARLHRERQIAIVVATHDLNFAASLCDELVLLRAGQVLRSGPTADVLTGDAIEALYGVEADVRFHERAGHLTVVPVRRTERGHGSPRHSE
jgi:iron complex transport system ATP-binding protein